MLRVAAGFFVGVALTAIVFILWARVPSSPLLVAILPPTATFTPTPTATPTATPTSTLTPTATATATSTSTPFPTATFTPSATAIPSITPSATVDNSRLSSLRNPVPLGAHYPLTLGGKKEFTIEIVTTDRGPVVDDLIKRAMGYLPTKPDGTEFMILSVIINYAKGPDGVPLGIDKYAFACISDGAIMPITTAEGPSPLNGNILPGVYAEGTVVELVNKDDPNPLIGLGMGNTADGSAGFFFATK